MSKAKRKAAGTKPSSAELTWRSTKNHYTGDYSPILRIRGGLMLVSHTYTPEPCMVTWNFSALDEFIREARKNSRFTVREATKEHIAAVDKFQARYAPFFRLVHPLDDFQSLIEPNIPGFTDAPKAARDKLFTLRDELKRWAIFVESKGRKVGQLNERTPALRKAIMGEYRNQKKINPYEPLSGHARTIRGLLKNSSTHRQNVGPAVSAKRIESIIRSELKKKHPTTR